MSDADGTGKQEGEESVTVHSETVDPNKKAKRGRRGGFRTDLKEVRGSWKAEGRDTVRSKAREAAGQ